MFVTAQDDFSQMMRNLPVPVSDEDIEEMFDFADKNNSGKISYNEFKVSKKNQKEYKFNLGHLQNKKKKVGA